MACQGLVVTELSYMGTGFSLVINLRFIFEEVIAYYITTHLRSREGYGATAATSVIAQYRRALAYHLPFRFVS